jgi:Baculovirus F protein
MHSQDIRIKPLDNNPGLIPVELGEAKVKETTHSFLFFYDLTSIITELKKLDLKTDKLTETVSQNSLYENDTDNYFKILNFCKEKAFNKLFEILPHHRTKRGLINGIGSIFKSITGNLDANDGEKYDQLIGQLQNNQIKLSESVKCQNSLMVGLIDKFNDTIQKVSHNEKLLEAKLEQISIIIQGDYRRKQSNIIKDIIIQLINLYEIVISILQDIENSITFARIGVMHPSIIKTEDLFKELLILQQNLGKEKLPIEVKLNNTLLFEKIIKIHSYLSGDKITYILEIPITNPTSFKLYNLHPIPVFSNGHFKTILPKSKYLLRNELYFSFVDDDCVEMTPHKYICFQTDLQKIKEADACEIQLFNARNISNCRHIDVSIRQPILQRLDDTNQWIIVLPTQVTITLECFQQREILRLTGTYLLDVPFNCKVITPTESIQNENHRVISSSQSIIFPEIDTEQKSTISKPNFSLDLEKFDINKLEELRTRILQNDPILDRDTPLSFSPSIWTILIYGILSLIAASVLYTRLSKRRRDATSPTAHNQQIDLQTVQIPR